MPVELDHVFVLTAPKAAVADRLIEFGLIEGSPNTHPGQGTANRRFFFQNFMLEFLFVIDVDEATNGPGAGMRLAERIAQTSASPFGFVLRGRSSEFPGWTYCPKYFPRGTGFHVGSNSADLTEPLCILLPDRMLGKGSYSRGEVQANRLTALQLCVPGDEPSQPLSALAACPEVELRTSAPHHLHLVLDEGATGRRLELSPEAPLTISM